MVTGEFSDLAASAPAARAGVGGLVMFGQPPGGSGSQIQAGLTALAADALSQKQVTPWFSTDEEGGDVARLSNVIGPLPTARQMAAQWTPDQMEGEIAKQASMMRSLGVTMDLAPTLDSASPSDAVADESDRSFSEDPRVVRSYGVAFIDGLRSGGLVPVAKHFPGLGHASADTDIGPSIDPALAQLEKNDLIPFEGAIAAGVKVVMVGNVTVPGLTDGLPATLSPATYRLLRGRYHFTGVALTDALNAGAISAAGYSQQAAALTAIEAGADMAMISASSWPSTIALLTRAVSSGALPLSRVDTAVERILTAKSVSVCNGS